MLEPSSELRGKQRFVRGMGRFVDDLTFPNQAYAAFVRSPHAHARIKSVRTESAKRASGVLAVITASDLAPLCLGAQRCRVPLRRPDGGPAFLPGHPGLVTTKVRSIGDPIAMVVASDRISALNGSELVSVEYHELPAVTSAEEAVQHGAAEVWDENPGNVAFYHAVGDHEAVDAAFLRADHVIQQRFVISRVMANPIETRGCVGIFDERDQRYIMYAGIQAPHMMREAWARDIFPESELAFRVVSPDVGGSFGVKGAMYPEYPVVLAAARLIGRPIKWISDRSEAFTSDAHGRDNITVGELALSKEGSFIAVRVRTTANLGAYLLGDLNILPPITHLGSLAGVYRTPLISAKVTGILTHTNQVTPYRGAGRPEATYVIERLIDLAADKLGWDSVELRKKNLITTEEMPFKTGLTFTYDCGDFAGCMSRALERSGYGEFELRRKASKARGLLRGIGVSCPIEQAASPIMEMADLQFDASGNLTVLLGTSDHGQGHEAAFSKLISEQLGLDGSAIRYVDRDTDKIRFGKGTFGSRSVSVGGSALRLAGSRLIEKARLIVAHHFEVEPSDVSFEHGVFAVSGTDRQMDISSVARLAVNPAALPSEVEPGLMATATFAPRVPNFPNACHVCELEIDAETGQAAILKYTVVDDVGNVISPEGVKGQIVGGIAQGAGQALMERVYYDPVSCQLMTGSFLDYAMPRATDLPMVEVVNYPVPTPTNPLGAKGAGEAGTVGSLAAVMNAIVDALSPLGIHHVDMPATPQTIWHALKRARTG